MWRPSARGTAVAAGRITRVGRALRPVARHVGGHLWLLLAVFALATFIVGWSTIHLSNPVIPSLQPPMALLEAAPVLLMARSSFIAWCVSALGALVWWLVFPSVTGAVMPWPVLHFLVLLATVVVASMFARPQQVVTVLFGSAALFAFAMPTDLKPWAFGQALFVAFGLLARWLVISRRQLAKASQETETERARRAVVEERSRIARELHDVVAHHMSMIVVQAQSAPVRLDGVSPQVRDEFVSIENSARQALGEVRGVLGVLREECAETAMTPQPKGEDITELLESARAAGVDLTWRTDLAGADVPPGPGLVLHRILQEALANAMRHAPGATIEVVLQRRGGSADLTVRNDRPRRPAVRPWPDQGGGHGITGMRTRAEAVGGDVQAGPTAGGGFLVEARIPLDAANL